MACQKNCILDINGHKMYLHLKIYTFESNLSTFLNHKWYFSNVAWTIAAQGGEGRRGHCPPPEPLRGRHCSPLSLWPPPDSRLPLPQFCSPPERSLPLPWAKQIQWKSKVLNSFDYLFNSGMLFILISVKTQIEYY